jgi:hypothetical protein
VCQEKNGAHVRASSAPEERATEGKYVSGQKREMSLESKFLVDGFLIAENGYRSGISELLDANILDSGECRTSTSRIRKQLFPIDEL